MRSSTRIIIEAEAFGAVFCILCWKSSHSKDKHLLVLLIWRVTWTGGGSPDWFQHEQSVCFFSREAEVGGILKRPPRLPCPPVVETFFMYITVEMEYNHPIFQLSLWRVKEGLFDCFVGFITWLALVPMVYHKLWLVYTSLQYETGQNELGEHVVGKWEFEIYWIW